MYCLLLYSTNVHAKSRTLIAILDFVTMILMFLSYIRLLCRVIKTIFVINLLHKRLSAIIAMQIIPYFMVGHRLQLVFKPNVCVVVFTSLVGAQPKSVKLFPPFLPYQYMSILCVSLKAWFSMFLKINRFTGLFEIALSFAHLFKYFFWKLNPTFFEHHGSKAISVQTHVDGWRAIQKYILANFMIGIFTVTVNCPYFY